MHKQVNLLVFAMLTLFLGVACGEETSNVPSTSEEREKLMQEALLGTTLKRIKRQLIDVEVAEAQYVNVNSNTTKNNQVAADTAKGKVVVYIEAQIKKIAAPNKTVKSGLRPGETRDIDFSKITSGQIEAALVEQRNKLYAELSYYLIQASNGLYNEL